jgi:hypothetical protein
MLEIGNIRRLKTWRVHGWTWLNGKGDSTKRDAVVVTEPAARAEDAIRLGHAARAAQEPAEPARRWTGVDFGELVHIWDTPQF